MSGRQSAATAKALRMVARGSTPYAAARKAGLSLSTIYRALKRLGTPAASLQRPAHPRTSESASAQELPQT